MPISKYFKGHGNKVMESMVAKHGAEEGKREFYATANKFHMKPKNHNAMAKRIHGE